ncbi:SpvB/TcaC N-terminal domain-containing protein [Cupriavidus sp. P-10]|uniref:SpvB/TcaC N-terminal domain-containing protein n=1 Tax=Cupriavidus sp. TA19 TaxID=701108 RepID=UPI000E2F485C
MRPGTIVGEAAGDHQETRRTAAPPSLTLAKRGGAIRGIGEKFAAIPVTGTGAMSVPLATIPGRSGFGPQLSFALRLRRGTVPFGFGWLLCQFDGPVTWIER